MRLIITLALVIGSIYAGWHFYPELYKTISGKEPVLKANIEAEAGKADATAPADSKAETSPETTTAGSNP